MCLLQVQRNLDQHIVSHVWNQCPWLWILTLLHPCRKDLSWGLLSVISVSITVVSLNLFNCSTTDFLPPLLWSQRCSLWSVSFLCVVLLVPRNLDQSSTTYIPCFFCSLARIYLIFLGFTHQFLLSLQFEAELLSYLSRPYFRLTHDPKEKLHFFPVFCYLAGFFLCFSFLVFSVIESQNQKITWVGRELQRSSSPTLLQRVGPSSNILSPSKLTLKISRDGASTTSHLFQCFITLIVKVFFLISNLNLPSLSLKLLFLVL